MGNGEIVSEFVDRKEALSSASLSADRCNSLKIPSVQGLVYAAETKELIFPALGVLVNIFAHHVKKSQRDGPRQKWDQSILLELICEDRGVALALWAHC